MREIFLENLLRDNIVLQYKRFNFGYDLSIFEVNSSERPSRFCALYRLPLEGFSCNSMFGRYRQSIWTVLVWLWSVSYCSVAVLPAVAGSTDCILMFLCVTWHTHWYIWLLYVADGYVAYCSVAVWPAVAGSTDCILMFLYVTWHTHTLIYMAAVYCWWLLAYCSVAVWPTVAGSTDCILMFFCVTWHTHPHTLIYMAAVCCWWLCSIFKNCVSTVDFMPYWGNSLNM